MTAIASLLSTTAVTSPGLPAPASGATSTQLPGFALPLVDLPACNMPVVDLPAAGGRQAPAGSGNALPVQSDDEALAWLNVADVRSSTLGVAHLGEASDDPAQAVTRYPSSAAIAPSPRALPVTLATAIKSADHVPVDGAVTIAVSTRAARRDADASDDVPVGRADEEDEHDTSADSADPSILPVVLADQRPLTDITVSHPQAAPAMVGTEPEAVVPATPIPTAVDRVSSAPRSDAAEPWASIAPLKGSAPSLAEALVAAPRQQPAGPDNEPVNTTASVTRAASPSGDGRASADTMPGEDAAAVTAPTFAHPRQRDIAQRVASGSSDALVGSARSPVQPRHTPEFTAPAGDADVAHAPSPATGPISPASIDTPAAVSTPPVNDLGDMSVIGDSRASRGRATTVAPPSISLPSADLMRVSSVEAAPLSVAPASSAPDSRRPLSSDTFNTPPAFAGMTPPITPPAFARTIPPITPTVASAAEAVPSPSTAAPIARGASVPPVPIADAPTPTRALLDLTERPAGLDMAAPIPARVASPATPLASAPVAAIAAPMPVSAPAAQVFAAAIHRALGERDEQPSRDPIALSASVAGTVAGLAPVGTASQGAFDMRHEHWPATMIERIVTLRDMAAENDTRLRLSPDMLGTIDVSLRRDGDWVEVQITAEQAQTRQLLADAQPRLAELADARGVKLQLAGGHAGAGHSGAGHSGAGHPSAGQAGTGQSGPGGDAPRQQAPATPLSTRPRSNAARGEAADTDQRIA